MSQARIEHSSLKRKNPAYPMRHKAIVLKSDKEGELSEILEDTSALSISGVMGSFFDLAFPRIL